MGSHGAASEMILVNICWPKRENLEEGGVFMIVLFNFAA